MLRSFFVFLSHATWAQRVIMRLEVTRRMSSRFVAGETWEKAILAISQLNALGINATLDHLGENTTSPEAASQAVAEVIHLLEEIDRSGVRANVSVKLSQLGLSISPELCRENLRSLLEKSTMLGNFIRIDMEDATLTAPTLDTFFWARRQGYEHTGVAIQSYLFRSEADVSRILEVSGKVRLCKGAYKESPEVAFPLKKDVDQNYEHLAQLLLAGTSKVGSSRLSADGRIPPLPALATHDVHRIQQVLSFATQLGLHKDELEFQMLYGIRRDLQTDLAAAGYPVRVYVPYGTHWYPYFMRRLGERPANIWFLASNLFRK
jgi:proline dehydrogenase